MVCFTIYKLGLLCALNCLKKFLQKKTQINFIHAVASAKLNYHH